MAFADWKKRNTIVNSSIPMGYHAMAYRVAQAAYKAGERDAERREREGVRQSKIGDCKSKTREMK